MNQLYQVLGISKQGVNQYAKRQDLFNDKIRALLYEAEELRSEHPGCGVEKMYYTLQPDFIGRDRFIAIFMALGFRLKRPANYKRTTSASLLYYPNLIKGMEINKPSMVWQSDITYIAVGEKFYYSVFIIDVYTKKIVGYEVSTHMRATANTNALTMALKQHTPPLIHHSDRGSQYTYKEYIKTLRSYNTRISMSLSAQDNAYAERINRTIKEEYVDHWKPKTFEHLKICIDKAIHHYNTKRPHNNLFKLSPVDFEDKWVNNKLASIPVFTIFDNEALT